MSNEFDEALSMIVNLLRQTSSVDIARDYLRQVDGVSFSASGWEEMQLRFATALEVKAITIDDLWAFQMDAEEHGRQHIFLYLGDKELAAEIIDESKVRVALRKAGYPVELGATLLIDKPDVPTISNVRIEPSAFGGKALAIKIVETRVHREALPMKRRGDLEFYRYRRHPFRGVNVVRLHSDGTLEIRIREHTRHDESGTGPIRAIKDPYKIAIAKARAVAATIFPYQSEFASEESLFTAKQALVRDHRKLLTKIRFNFSTLGNSEGVTAKFGTRSFRGNLGATVASAGAMAEWMKHRGSFPEALNLWWLEGVSKGEPTPSKDIHVKIGGVTNEFVVPVNCIGKDYNHVLYDIKRYNRKAP